MYGSLTFSPPRNFAVFDGWYFLQYCLLKIVQIAQVNQLLIIEFRQYIWPQLLRVKSYANEEKCKQWHQQRVAYKYPYGLISYKKSRKSTLLVNYLIRPHTTTNFHLHTTVTATIGHFRVARSLCFKERLNSKLSIRIGFFSHKNKTHFHKKGFLFSLDLKVRVSRTRKWLIIQNITQTTPNRTCCMWVESIQDFIPQR